MDLLQEFYETTLEALKDAKNDRLWFKTNTKVERGSSKMMNLGFLSFQHVLRPVLFPYCAVRKTVLGERRIWKTAKDPSTASPVLSSNCPFLIIFLQTSYI